MNDSVKFVEYFYDDDMNFIYVLFDDFTYLRVVLSGTLGLRSDVEKMTKKDFKQKFKTF